MISIELTGADRQYWVYWQRGMLTDPANRIADYFGCVHCMQTCRNRQAYMCLACGGLAHRDCTTLAIRGPRGKENTLWLCNSCLEWD